LYLKSICAFLFFISSNLYAANWSCDLDCGYILMVKHESKKVDSRIGIKISAKYPYIKSIKLSEKGQRPEDVFMALKNSCTLIGVNGINKKLKFKKDNYPVYINDGGVKVYRSDILPAAPVLFKKENNLEFDYFGLEEATKKDCTIISSSSDEKISSEQRENSKESPPKEKDDKTKVTSE
jgi:hypothetical protein